MDRQDLNLFFRRRFQRRKSLFCQVADLSQITKTQNLFNLQKDKMGLLQLLRFWTVENGMQSQIAPRCCFDAFRRRFNYIEPEGFKRVPELPMEVP